MRNYNGGGDDGFAFYRDINVGSAVDKELEVIRRDARNFRVLGYAAAMESMACLGYYAKEIGYEYDYVLLLCSAAAAVNAIFAFYHSSKYSRKAHGLEEKINQ